MDDIDRRILEILQQDASLSNVELAEKLSLSPSSCLRRVQKLKADGVITQTVALVDPDKLDRSLCGIVEVSLERHGTEARLEFIEKIQQEGAITQAYSVTGEADVILVMHLKDMKEYAALCDRMLNYDPNVVKFRTFFAMEQYKHTTAIPTNTNVTEVS
ncbi:Lrp/AsnC family transcriptional regulator [Pontibacterium sp.]|uniref:Lrp/AsnC family transcriptional regulator n=1 Tax=Pontibacterium sp. TaxID=2036026 RepID=UPI0035174CA1